MSGYYDTMVGIDLEAIEFANKDKFFGIKTELERLMLARINAKKTTEERIKVCEHILRQVRVGVYRDEVFNLQITRFSFEYQESLIIFLSNHLAFLHMCLMQEESERQKQQEDRKSVV